MLFSLTLKRASRLVTLVGLVAFAASFGALTIFAADWAAIIIPAVPQTVLTAIIAQFAMSVTRAIFTRHQNRENEQMRTAINSMAQGLFMFDAAERLVVCNAQY